MTANPALDGRIDWSGSLAALIAAFPNPAFPNGTLAPTTDQGMREWSTVARAWVQIGTIGNYGPANTPLVRWRPAGTATAATFTGAIVAASTGTLTGNWAGATGLYQMSLSTGQQVLALLTGAGTAVTFYPFPENPTGGTYGPALAVSCGTAATVVGQAPLLGVANAYALSQAIVSTTAVLNGAQVTGGAGTPDCPRNIIGAWTGTAIATVVGTDYYGLPQTEVSASGTSLTTKKTFATIVSVTMNASVTGATFGTGNVLGLPVRCSTGDIMDVRFNDAADAGTFVAADITLPATSSTGDVRGTYVPAGTLNGAKYLTALLKPTNPATQFGTLGVTPA